MSTRTTAARDIAAAMQNEIRVRRAELAALERGLAIMQRTATGEGELRCGVGAAGFAEACSGHTYARYCPGCAGVAARCEGHGGSRALHQDMQVHRSSCPALSEEGADV